MYSLIVNTIFYILVFLSVIIIIVNNVRPTIFATFVICVSIIIPFQNEIMVTYKFHAPYGQFVILGNDLIGSYVITVRGDKTITVPVKHKEFIGGIYATNLTEPTKSSVEISNHELKFSKSYTDYLYIYILKDNSIHKFTNKKLNGKKNI